MRYFCTAFVGKLYTWSKVFKFFLSNEGCVHVSALKPAWWGMTGDKHITSIVTSIAISRKALLFLISSMKRPESLMQNLPFCKTDLNCFWDTFSSNIAQFKKTVLPGSSESLSWILGKNYNFPRTLAYFILQCKIL